MAKIKSPKDANDGVDWTLRRRTILFTLLYAVILIGYLMIWGDGNSELASTLVDYLMVLIGGTIGGYVFGAAADNHVNGEFDRAHSLDEHQITDFAKDTRLGSWKQRRRAMLGVLFACILGLGYLTFKAPDTRLHETLAGGICILYITVLNSWIFGAVYDGYATRRKIMMNNYNGYSGYNNYNNYNSYSNVGNTRSHTSATTSTNKLSNLRKF